MKLGTENINLFQLMAALLLTHLLLHLQPNAAPSRFIAATLPRIARLLCAAANFRN